MGRILPKKVGSLPDSFIVQKMEALDYNGEEFRDNFVLGCPSIIQRIDLQPNDSNVNFVIKMIIKDAKTGDTRILKEESVSGFWSWFDKLIFVGANEYFGIITDGLDEATVPGSSLKIVASLAK